MSEPEDLPGGPQGSCDVQRAMQKRGRLRIQQPAPLVWGFIVNVLKICIFRLLDCVNYTPAGHPKINIFWRHITMQNKTIAKRTAALLLALLMTVGIFAGCSKGGGSGEKKSVTVTVTLKDGSTKDFT